MDARVLVVEDDGFTRMLLCAQVRELGFSVVGDTGSVAEAVLLLRDHQPDATLVDLDLGEGPTGVDFAYAARRVLPNVGILMLSTYADVRLMGVTRPLPLGSIYLVKRAVEQSSILDAALRMAIDPRLYGDLENLLPQNILPKMSNSQIEVMRLVADGFSNAEISRRRQLTEGAVAKSIARLVQQLGLSRGPGENQRVLIAQAYFLFAGTVSLRRD